METQWRGHTVRVTGDWVWRYLFLAPQYELWLDDQRIDIGGGPRVRPKLEAIIEIAGEDAHLLDAPEDGDDDDDAILDEDPAASEDAAAATPASDEEGDDASPLDDREDDGEDADDTTRASDGPHEPTLYHLEAEILSIAGLRPSCQLRVDGEVIHSDRVRVANLLNPFLLLFIIGATAWMIYVGPSLLRSYLGM